MKSFCKKIILELINQKLDYWKGNEIELLSENHFNPTDANNQYYFEIPFTKNSILEIWITPVFRTWTDMQGEQHIIDYELTEIEFKSVTLNYDGEKYELKQIEID